MMCKKWRIIGRNKLAARLIAALLAVALLAGMPIFSASAATPSALKDLDPAAWYYKEVSGAINLGLFAGVSGTEFGVDRSITRAQFVTALARLCGKAEPTESVNQFTDVKKGAWYYHFVSWAYKKGLVNGVSNTEFAPDRPITRQEMCKMLGSTVEWLSGKTLSTKNAKVFADRGEIADWAKTWVNKCSANGLINGKENNRFVPLGQAKRQEAACVFYRYYAMTYPERLNFGLTVSGFTLNFDVDTDYYLCSSTKFSQCKITGYTGFTAINVQVEQYASYKPYASTAYKLGDNLKLGQGRAKITVTATLAGGIQREYLIVVTDPSAAINTYAQVEVNSTLNVRKEPNATSKILTTLNNGKKVYYFGHTADGKWCKVQVINTATVGYVSADYLQWAWEETNQPTQYKAAIDKLKKAHPNWTFSYVDVEMSYADALNTYGAAKEEYINPANYLNEDKIYAFLDIDTYDTRYWNDNMIKAIWAKETAITKSQAVTYFGAASKSLQMNPVYLACRAALEGGYGTSSYAKGKSSVTDVTIESQVKINGKTLTKGTHYDHLDLGGTFYNMFGIGAYDDNPNWCMVYAANRNWNSVFRAITEGGNWIKDQYLDHGSTTPYFFRYASYKRSYVDWHYYMTDPAAPAKEASILKRAYTDPNAAAHFVIPVYRNLPTA